MPVRRYAFLNLSMPLYLRTIISTWPPTYAAIIILPSQEALGELWDSRAERHTEHVFGFLRALGTAGNLTTDAHLAAIAIEYGCTLYSVDADFARFKGLRWRNPIANTGKNAASS